MEEEKVNKNVDPAIVLERIRKWQEEPVFHELTCWKDSGHELLKGKQEGDKVVLVCPTCGYVQKNIPDMFYRDSFDEAYNYQRKMLDELAERLANVRAKKAEQEAAPVDAE